MVTSRLDRTGEGMNAEAIRRIHDAAVQLGAHCNSDRYFNPSMCENKAYTERARALMFFVGATLNPLVVVGATTAQCVLMVTAPRPSTTT